MRIQLIRLLPVLLAMHASATGVFAQVRVTVSNVPGGLSMQAILNAGNDSKPLTPTERSGDTVTFALLADSANYGKPVQVYLVREEDDDDRPPGVVFIIDNGAVPPNGRLLDTFTLTAQTTDIVVDYQTGQVTERRASQAMEEQPGYGRGVQLGLDGEWITFPKAGEGVCESVPTGSTLTRCDLDRSGGGLAFSAGYDYRLSRVGLGFDVAYSTGSEITLHRAIASTTNPNLTATNDFREDAKILEMFFRPSWWLSRRTQLAGIAGAARVESRTTNTFVTLLGGTPVDTQTTTANNVKWSPVLGGSITIWVDPRLGFEAGYRWLRPDGGAGRQPMHKVIGGVRFNLGPH